MLRLITGAQALSTAVNTAVALCPPAAGAAAGVQASQSQLSASISATQNNTAIAAAESSTITQGGVSTRDALEEAVMSGTQTMEASVTTVLTSLVAGAANPITAASCSSAAATVTTAEMGFNQAVAVYIPLVTEVTQLGKVCAYIGLGAAVGDLGISMSYGQDLAKSLISVAGAAPSAYSLIKMILTQQTPIGTVSSLGVGSCLSAAAALLEIGVKTMNMSKTSESIKKNQESLKKLESASIFALFPIAYALEGSRFATQSECQYREKTPLNLFNCGLQLDPVLGKALYSMERKNAFISSLDHIFAKSGASSKDFLTETPLSFSQVAQLMTQGHPHLTPKVIEIYQKIGKNLGLETSPETPIDTSTKLTETVPKETPTNPINSQSVTTPAQRKHETLFELISRRYQIWQEKIELEKYH